MEKLKYVSREYQERLDRLAETLCTPERFAGQAVLAEVVELFPTAAPGPEAA